MINMELEIATGPELPFTTLAERHVIPSRFSWLVRLKVYNTNAKLLNSCYVSS